MLESKITNIVSFGCSWAYGDEIIDPVLAEQGISYSHRYNDVYRISNCYTGLVAEHYGYTHQNLAFPGSSLQAMQWSLMWWLNNKTPIEIKESIILVGLTGEDRISWYDPNYETGNDDPWNNYLHSTWLDYAGPNVDRGWFDLRKHHIAMSSCDQLSQLNYETTVRMFDGVSARYDVPVIQFNTVATRTIANDTFYDLQIRNSLPHNCYASGGHPNENGHRIIAKKLISTIDRYMK